MELFSLSTVQCEAGGLMPCTAQLSCCSRGSCTFPSSATNQPFILLDFAEHWNKNQWHATQGMLKDCSVLILVSSNIILLERKPNMG